MVEFLETIHGDDFTYEKGKRYVAIHDSKDVNLQDKVFVRQPNSPKKRNWWTEFSKTAIDNTFRILDDSELDILERIEENNRLLEL
jgi:hypothetical protein